MLSKIDNRFEKLRRRCIEFIFQGREYTVTSTNCICHQVLSIARTWSASPVWIWKTNRIVGRFTKSIRINEPRWGYRNLIGVSLIMSGQTDFQFRYSFDVMIRIVIFYVIAVCSTLFFFFFFAYIPFSREAEKRNIYSVEWKTFMRFTDRVDRRIKDGDYI